MRRPGSIFRTNVSTYKQAMADELVAYFESALAKALAVKASDSQELFVYPTVTFFCKTKGVSHSTLQGWAKKIDAMKSALERAAAIRVQIGACRLPSMVFDSEVDKS